MSGHNSLQISESSDSSENISVELLLEKAHEDAEEIKKRVEDAMAVKEQNYTDDYQEVEQQLLLEGKEPRKKKVYDYD